jgi:RNA polymerase sigma factor (sigma-70 family)
LKRKNAAQRNEVRNKGHSEIDEDRISQQMRDIDEAITDPLEGFCRKLTRGRHFEAMDLAQDVRLGILKHLRRGGSIENPLSFAMATAVNRFRRLMRGPRMEQLDMEVTDPKPILSEAGNSSCALRILLQKAQCLTALERKIIEQHYQIGLSARETGELNAMTKNQVDGKLRLIRKKLRS